MSILNQLASALGRQDEEPNQQLAAHICAASEHQDVRADVQELVDNLQNRNKHIQSDCVKVLYEIGGRKPELIEAYTEAFVALLDQP